MGKKFTKSRTGGLELDGANAIEFILDETAPISSQALIQNEDVPIAFANDKATASRPLADDPEIEVDSPVFKELATPKLPELSRENRARLLMQSPNQLFFYWSVKNNPFQTLNRAIGSKTNSYTLVAKLVNLKNGREELQPIDAEGSAWFNVDANAEYQAEVGFYAFNRPYVRVMFSNKVATPRKNPSPRPASSAEWTVSADKFSEVLEVAGFSQDAFDVALAGDDWHASEQATGAAFSNFVGEAGIDGIDSEEIRLAMLALAAGVKLEDLRWRISPSLFAILQTNSANLNSEKALAALQEQFGFDADEIVEQERTSPAVFGASLINFPHGVKRRQNRNLTKFSPLSSFSIGSNK